MTTKQYLRFSPGQTFGVVASSTASIIPVKQDEGPNLKDNFFAVPACENVYIWNLRTKEKNVVLSGENSIVTCLVADSSQKNIAVGYADGMVRIFNIRDGECNVSFIGHKTAVSCLTFEDGGSNLASGGKDSEIVVWNVIDEAGLFRLKGHKGPISKCIFYQPRNCLISSSKDTYIKFWDLDTQHCFHTLVGSQYEILDMALIKGTRLIVGLNNQRLRAWNIFAEDDTSSNTPLLKKLKTDEQELSLDVEQDEGLIGDEDEENSEFRCKTVELNDLPNTENKICAIVVDPAQRLMGIHGSTKFLHLFKILKEDELKKKLRKKKAKEAKRKSAGDEDDSGYDESSPTIEDEFRTLKPIQLTSKVDSFCISVNESDVAMITALLKNNTVVQYELDIKLKQNIAEIKKSISIPGHRSFVRTLSCCSNGYSILSASDETVKIWRRGLNDEQKCTTTLPCEASLCSVFVPGNKHCIVGTKNGLLNIYDVDKRELVNSIESHDGFVKCICLSPDLRGVTSGGSDKEVKFWELVSEDKHSLKQLSLAQRRTLQMSEEVLCLKYSPDGKKLAVALLDSTVQVLFSDSLKLAFSLYGHEFPVTCLDISYDSTLIITGSNDRTIRIWSMEFGSCNRRLKIANEKGLPNDKGITCLQFLAKTHLFFSGSKDHLVRQWDADNFQKIITLKGHQNEITAMAASPDGTFIVTASKDRSIRTWEKTLEPLVLEEEQEIEAEEREKETEDLPTIPGEVNKEVALSGMKTPQTIKTVDQLIEALALYKAETRILGDYSLLCEKAEKKPVPPPLHPLFIAYNVSSPIEYMRKAVLKIKSSELEGALIHLPFNFVLDFLNIMAEFADRGWETEFCEKCTTFLIRIHFGQISTTRNFRPIIEKLQEKLFQQMYNIGVSIAL
ncbi:WD repeat-containing protein 3 [Araneus ventricosus]|uniref:WD repeat-containing protein 3 n=1 Tax=Araneus ventricosus TaxID=182803 RepID=A0A4Y2DR14_ARAVE|nr:WD repeat-containing protein 3 [Araneus ventricosus]